MTVVRLRPLAERDLVERTQWYRVEVGDDVARRFFDAAAAGLDAIKRMSGAGSPTVGELCGIPGLRFRRITGFPCAWFYLVRDGHVDVARLLSEAQNLQALFADLSFEPPN